MVIPPAYTKIKHNIGVGNVSDLDEYCNLAY